MVDEASTPAPNERYILPSKNKINTITSIKPIPPLGP